MFSITADVGNDPVRHGDTDYGGDIREQEQYPRYDSQLVHFVLRIVDSRD